MSFKIMENNEQTLGEALSESESLTAAIITDVELCHIDHVGYCLSMGFDVDRVGHVGLSFSNLKDIGVMLNDAKVGTMEDLKGKPCYMKKKDNGIWDFKHMWKVS